MNKYYFDSNRVELRVIENTEKAYL